MPRLFVAIDLPEEQRDQLEDLCSGLPDARWTPHEQLHLTLAFIGDVDGGRARDIDDELAAVRGSAFELVARGVGHFPPRGVPRVAWAGIEPTEPLMALQRAVARAVERAGAEMERRKFHPHVTLARLHDPPAEHLAAWLRDHAGFRGDPFLVREFSLFSSTLGKSGATHAVEATYPLGS